MNRSLRGTLFALVAVLALSLGQFLDLYVDWLWFDSLDHGPVFLKALRVRLAVGIAGAGAFYLLAFGNWWTTRRLLDGIALEFDEDMFFFRRQGEVARRFHAALPWVLGFAGFLVGLSLSGEWARFLALFHQAPFGETDPLFGKDIGFYVFTFPVLRLVQSIGLSFLFFVIIVVAAVYFLERNIQLGQDSRFRIGRGAQIHLAVLLAGVFLLKGWGYWLDRYDLLFANGKALFGAAYTDVHARLPALNILAGLAVAAAAGVVLSVVTRAFSVWRSAIVGASSLFLFSLAARGLIPEMLQNFKVQPNEIQLERPFLERNIAATRAAFGLQNMKENPFPAARALDRAAVERNRTTLDNVRLWDHRPLLKTFSQLQEIRTYYRFARVDNGRYMIDGKLRQVMLSARELDHRKLPSRQWINEHLTYTHGHGLVMSRVDESTKEGQPKLLIKDIPPSAAGGLTVDRPEVYYGEIANDYVVVDTLAKELDYPSGDENVYARYEGNGGVLLSNLLRKWAFVLKFNSLKILLSEDITEKSRIMFHRRIAERAGRVAPFLGFDQDPYLVLADGRLRWILDGYTLTDRYPYSQPAGKLNYLRNSVKAVIDAYDGSVEFFVSDSEDPLVKTYSAMFPSLFRPLNDMPASLRAHLRYPQDLFEIQAGVYSRFHMTDPQVFYNDEDRWTIPQEVLQGKETRMEPYYTIMRLPGETKEEYVLMIPFTPLRRDNMIAWMAARSDPPHAGEVTVFRFPKEKLIYGPMQIEARINQDDQITQQFKLWEGRGTRIIRGNLLVIPVEESLLYVEPVYLQADLGKIPELKRVIVAYAEAIAMEPTLEAALARVLSVQPPGEAEKILPALAESAGGDLPARALQTLRRAQAAQRSGDWAGYGKALKELERQLKEMNR